MTEVVIQSDADAAATAATLLADRITRDPELVLGLATGSSPLHLYRALAERVTRDGIPMDRLRAFALDEYAGLDPEHPQSYLSTIRREAVEPLGLDPERVHVPDGSLERLPTAGERYEEAIALAGGVDVQILGIGTDGHIGFNEPGSSLASRTRIKTLTAQTRRDNARFFDSPEQVPTHCVTQGIGTILAAGHLLLFASGAHKADAVARAVEGPVSAGCPASAIQLHPRVTVFVDEAAASRLEHADYYRAAYEAKPAWQGL
ncbi:glucosamine-6-phosphate deaminase [Pseudoclavibacter chungangensis]|uniref:Glucosamine-6-phosphate deaminase n=1 Tax=Pseudoclavibacter chungangensis TaxID=587635 RepID=A0A7J5BUE2_9MICO|nr:glucosamine-6-phosphate deaminase [Pseudoclavibacter chungangensis]KAB1657977.1 glucosamine-6-phosphate deaminase [Pseudoclavibacter chungangensis]NYJ65867.1 glucosamine-6-phosphate deaminase [Pseudoclavibacter chungangensis]